MFLITHRGTELWSHSIKKTVCPSFHALLILLGLNLPTRGCFTFLMYIQYINKEMSGLHFFCLPMALKYFVPDLLRSNTVVHTCSKFERNVPLKNVGENNFIPKIRIRLGAFIKSAE